MLIISQRDKEKQDACNEAGITYLSIPYWWDKQPQSLAATIVHQRPISRNSLTVELGMVIPEQATSNKGNDASRRPTQ